jgi:hypothetical protein
MAREILLRFHTPVGPKSAVAKMKSSSSLKDMAQLDLCGMDFWKWRRREELPQGQIRSCRPMRNGAFRAVGVPQ